MSKVNSKGSKFNQISKGEYAKLIFKNPCPSSSSEYLTLRLCSKDQKGTKQIVICEQNYQIHDDMKISQLKIKWFESNRKMNNFTLRTTIISSTKTKNLNKDNFIFTWNGKFQIFNNQCILTLKQKVGINKFFGNDLIKIYAQHDLPFRKDQLAFNYKVYEGKYLKKLDLGLKIVNLPQNKVHYFYLELQIDAKIQEIYKKSNTYFITEDLIKYQPEDGFRLLLLIQNEKELLKRLNSLQEKYQSELILNDNYSQIDLSKFKQRKIREVCYPGEIIQIKLNEPQKVKFGEDIKAFDNVEIVIQCNRNISSPQSVSQSQSLISSTSIIEKRRIKEQFSDIKRMKVSTLLRQNNIEECMSTSLCHRQLIIRPFERIDKLAQILSKDDKQLHFSLIPQNFLYYKQLTKKSIEKQRSSIDEVAARLTQSNIIDNQDYELIRSTRNRRVEQIKDQDLKQHDLIEPIVTYTSPWLFERFNSYLRQTSVSQLRSEQIQQKWQYSFCRTLLQSLLKLKNYKGVVYRGSSKFNYNYKVGQIIEWNAFSSTSKDIHIVLEYFLKQQHNDNQNQLYLFQIQTFSGKQISEFSFFAIENQVLILPYTRFKVMDIITETHCDGFEYQHVKMIQIPIPKKVNGNILVDVDIQHQRSQKQNLYRNRYDQHSQVSKSINYLSIERSQFIKLTSLVHFKEWLIEYKEILVLKNCKLIFLIKFQHQQQAQPDLNNYTALIQIVKNISNHSLVILYGKNIGKHQLNLTGITNRKNAVLISNLRQLEKLFSCEFDLNEYYNSSNLEQLEQVVYCEKCQIV